MCSELRSVNINWDQFQETKLFLYSSLQAATYTGSQSESYKETNPVSQTSIFSSLICSPLYKLWGQSKAKSSDMKPVPSVFIWGLPSLSWTILPSVSCNSSKEEKKKKKYNACWWISKKNWIWLHSHNAGNLTGNIIQRSYPAKYIFNFFNINGC